MIYPRIFSLSTVGVRHHYNQDYLIHAERTDFVGRNGVGKSIIADLLQLLFVFDKSLIRFGTEGIDKREIHTLPYKTSTAYVFLNVEIVDGSFIILGTCISDKRGDRLRPFVILKNANLDQDINKNCLDKDQLLFCQHFLKEKSIPSIDNLAKLVRDKYQLALTDFNFKADIDNYYKFLFKQSILPLDLSRESNLAAYAKVLQSFSKAKGLDLKKSEDLQTFLFENAKEEFFEEYNQHKNDLDKLLFDYKNLSNFIDELEHKQKVLEDLKKMEEAKNSNWQILQISQTAASYWTLQKSKDRALIAQQAAVDAKSELERLNIDAEDFTKREVEEKKIYDSVDNHYESVIAHKSLYQEILLLKKEIKNLTAHRSSIKKDAFPIVNNNRTVLNEKNTVVISAVECTMPFLFRYKSFSGIEKKYNEQKAQLLKLNLRFNQAISENKQFLSTLVDKTSTSFLSLVMTEFKKLTIEQESIVIHLANYQVVKPLHPSNGTRYILGIKALEQGNFETDASSEGLWLVLGEMREFVPLVKKRYFDTSDKFKSSIQLLIKNVEDQILTLTTKLEQLEFIQKGQPYSIEILKEYLFDPLLVEYSFIERLKQGVTYIENIDLIIDRSQKELRRMTSSNSTIEEILKHVDTDNVDSAIEILKNEKTSSGKRLDLIQKGKVANVTAKSARQALLPGLNDVVIEENKKLLDLEKKYQEDFNAFRKEFPNIILDLDGFISSVEVDEVKDKYQKSDIAYRSIYLSLPDRFVETKDKKDSRINLQIDNELYGFEEMEQVLLGDKIKHIDKIGEHLHAANQNRLSLIAGIRSNMIKVFANTIKKYKTYESIIKDVNTFFKGKKISDLFYFKIHFNESKDIPITWIDRLQTDVLTSYKSGELQFGKNIEDFIREVFQNLSTSKEKLSLRELLDPLTYFTMGVSLTDDNGEQIPGSTGETYSAISLLGIARLSKVQSTEMRGLRFLILEETANLDKTNFNTFPKIAKEYKYQIFTMTPEPYGGEENSDWYLHHLIKGRKDVNVNPAPLSYFKSRISSVALKTYLNALNKN